MAYSITEIDITQPMKSVSISGGRTGIAIVVRNNERPIAFLMKELPPGTALTCDELSELIRQEIEPDLLENNQSEISSEALCPGDLPSLTVSVCTRDNPQDLARCLNRLVTIVSEQVQIVLEILVVDNAPSNESTRELITSMPNVRYAIEPKPGLNFARNRALQESTCDFIAFIDDDVTVDRTWLSGFVKAVSEHPDAAAVTGLVLPSELETDAQILFEKRGGFEKSFVTILYDQSLPGHPFYPCVGGKFGTGCNMSFRRNILIDLGGFDEALDTGAYLPGGGDADMLYRVVRAGYPLIYEPQFMVFHRHRRKYKQLRRQYSRSWSQGLMAFVVKSYIIDSAMRPNLRRLVSWWFGSRLRDLLRSIRGRHILPPDIFLAEIWGGIVGLSIAYPRSVWRTKQIRRRFS